MEDIGGNSFYSWGMGRKVQREDKYKRGLVKSDRSICHKILEQIEERVGDLTTQVFWSFKTDKRSYDVEVTSSDLLEVSLLHYK